MRRIALLCVLAAAAVAAPAAARTADYARSDAQFAEDAAALNVGELAAMPQRGELQVMIEGAASLDHQLKILTIACKAWRVDNPLSQMVAKALGSWDRDGQLTAAVDAPLVRFKADGAFSTMRCVEVAELKARCITRTAINGTATVERQGSVSAAKPISVAVEHEQNIGACGGLSRGTALSGREASIRLVEQLKAAATN